MSTSTLPTDALPAGASRRSSLPGRDERQAAGKTAFERHGRMSPQAGRTLGLVGLLLGTAVLYLWSLGASGYANSFYSAAVQAGSQSWTAFVFGSLDASNAITVDTPPASLWLMALSVRIFGLSSWSILVPQALLGVATVGVLYASVRRTSGHSAGLLAGALLALTPAAALMFRFNNPDSLLVFLLTAASYVTLRATEQPSGKALAWAGVLVGFAFLTKMLQAFLVLPAFVLVYLVAAPTTLRRRVLHLLGAFGAMVAALGWWVALVELVPASWRPYVGGSETNSVLDLIFGYNGLGGSGGDGGGAGFGGEPGITRLFTEVSGGMITWLLPAALLLAAAVLVALRSAPRTDARRAAILTWTGGTVVTALTFSSTAGTYHDYYVVALAPGVAAGVVVSGGVLWSERTSWLGRSVLSSTTVVTAVWAFVLLGRATGVYESLRWAVLVVGLLAALGLLVAHRLPRAVASLVLALAVLGGAAGPAAYTLHTVATPHQGSIVTAGPVSGAAGGGQVPGSQVPPTGQTGGGGMGYAGTADAELTALLEVGGGSFRWAAATTGSQRAATYQLATELPVMAIGGFDGGDPSPTLEQFQAYVETGDIHYYVGGEFGGGPSGSNSSASLIAGWVADHYSATTVGGTDVYDLTSPT